MEGDKKQIRISVRGLVEFLLRSGDIEAATGGLRQTEAMLEGARIHRKIQKSRGPEYQPELALRLEVAFDEFDLVVEGRADGVFSDGDLTWIEEIKGIYRDPNSMDGPVPVHLAQAKCYAAIYARQNDASAMGVRMTYAQMEKEEIRNYDFRYEADELLSWFDGLVAEYKKWALIQVTHERARDLSMQGLEFPFPYREGQRDLVVAIYRTILRKKQIFAQAPTGVGKTMSAVFPAVRALGEGEGGKIFYLTAKTIARTVAEEAFSILRDHGLICRTVTLTAKEKICPMEETVCDPEVCPYAKGHYDRVNDALYEMLGEDEAPSRESILARCEKHKVCPHEFQLDLTLFSDAVICDYNYVFDPRAKLRRFFGEGGRQGEYIFLVDEAHNLVERGREMYSAELCKEDFLAAKKKVPAENKKLVRALDRCNKAMLAYRKESGGACREIENVEELLYPLMNLAGALELHLREDGPGRRSDREALLDLYFRARAFLSIYELLDEHYIICCRTEADKSFWIKLFCVDPSANLQGAMDAGRAAALYSATLLPIPYYRSLLSGRDDDYTIYIPSPFDKEKRLLAVCTDVSSKYTRRGEAEYRRMAAYIHAAVRAQAGNYLVFFPSYQMLDAVTDIYEADFASPGIKLQRQHPNMGEREREEFLAAFGREGAEEESASSRLGFCVMGGVFSEGIDLTGEKLIGAIVVGTGLPQIGDERELLRAYYDSCGRNGFDYAYRMPGMNKVLQAAGRVIRTAKDRGVILLLDERFDHSDYRGLFPREWDDRRRCRLEELPGLLEGFWTDVI